MERRGFFRSLVAGGATVTNSLAGKPLKHRREPIGVATYHGPMAIPAHVAEIVAEDPALHRVRGGGKDKLAARYAADGVVWLFRCRVPDHRQMVGDVRRTADGWRVCCWSAATPSPTVPPAERLMDGAGSRQNDGGRPAEPQAPPMTQPETDWTDSSEYSQYFLTEEEWAALNIPKKALEDVTDR